MIEILLIRFYDVSRKLKTEQLLDCCLVAYLLSRGQFSWWIKWYLALAGQLCSGIFVRRSTPEYSSYIFGILLALAHHNLTVVVCEQTRERNV